MTHFGLYLLETQVWCHRQCSSSMGIAARERWRLCIISPAFAALIGFANIVYPYLPNSRFADSPQSSHWLENWEGSILGVSVVCLIVKLAPLLMLLFGLSEEMLSTFLGLFDDFLMNFWGLYDNFLWTLWGFFLVLSWDFLRTFWRLFEDFKGDFLVISVFFSVTFW